MSNDQILQQLDDKTVLLASAATWIEGEAVRQLTATATLPGMRRCAGMPDLTPAKTSPTGAAYECDLVYPALVGSDIGCGMGLWQTSLARRKAKPDRLVAKLDGLDMAWDGDPAAWLSERGIVTTDYDASLGTPGHSNHFTELQEIIEIRDAEQAARLNLDAGKMQIVVHSGSRGLGEHVLHDIIERYGAEGLTGDSAQQYLSAHDHAMAWAVANRELCAERVLNALNISGHRVLDITHNSVLPITADNCTCYLHRKGAAPADRGPVIIPGSRGDVSFLVLPEPTRGDALHSLAHGAGRKIARQEAYGKLVHRYKNKDMHQTAWGGRLICGERDLVWEEAPECYKDVATVVGDMVSGGYISVIAVLRPLITFKTSEGARIEIREARKQRDIARDNARAAKHRR